jgi:ribonuclease T
LRATMPAMAESASPVDEALVSVDIEASGPSPGTGSMLSLGACLVEDPARGLYLELKPIPGLAWDAAAEGIHGLDRARLEAEGLEPAIAMAELETWLRRECGGRQPIFVGFNAPYDWMFVADYFSRFVGHNPFGISALDLKSLYMGKHGVTRWEDTRKVHVNRRLGLLAPHSHHALDDAREQAELARILLEYR